MPDDLNPTAGTVLGFLLDGARTGWELDRWIEGTVGSFWNVTRSQIYRELRQLTVKGLVIEGDAGPRERVPYEITEAGRRAFDAWLQRDLPGETRRIPVLLTTYFGQHLPATRLAELLDAHRGRNATQLATYRQLQDELVGEAYVQATVAYGIAYCEMVERWLDDVAMPLAVGNTEDVDPPS